MAERVVINIKKFDRPSEKWAKSILNNRDRNYKCLDNKECNADNKYDLVIGPVVADDIIILFRTFVNGLIDINILIKEFTYKELTDQYFFHTEKLSYLVECITQDLIQYLMEDNNISMEEAMDIGIM